ASIGPQKNYKKQGKWAFKPRSGQAPLPLTALGNPHVHWCLDTSIQTPMNMWFHLYIAGNRIEQPTQTHSVCARKGLE
ncbi:MAG: hypothetical protein LBP80_00175, partial [Treponema sp.]|nr:hypothetical protein [Treponema sp.]